MVWDSTNNNLIGEELLEYLVFTDLDILNVEIPVPSGTSGKENGNTLCLRE